VAIRQDVPWAYMAPIEPILNDIKAKLGTQDVHLPTSGEIERLAVPVLDTELGLINTPGHSKKEQQRMIPEDRGSSPYHQSEGLISLLAADPTAHALLPVPREEANLFPASRVVRPAHRIFTSGDSVASTCVNSSSEHKASGTAKTLIRFLSGRWSHVSSMWTWRKLSSRKGDSFGEQFPAYILDITANVQIARGIGESFAGGNVSDYWGNSDANVEKSSFRKPSPVGRFLRALVRILRLLYRVFAWWFITATLCSLYVILVVSELHRKDGASSFSRRLFNTGTVVISIALSVSIVSSLGAMASNIGWLILGTRPMSLTEVSRQNPSNKDFTNTQRSIKY
jgi:hypothetical protein